MKRNAVDAFRRGYFTDAMACLQNAQTSDLEDAVLRVETLYQRGFGKLADQEASQLLRAKLEHSLTSRCLSVRAAHLWDEGQLQESLEISRAAVDAAERGRQIEQITKASAQLLERTCDSEGFDATVPLASYVRRCAMRSGDAHLIAYVHLVYGRLEARAGRADAARRHFQLSRRLVEPEDNLFVLASADLGDTVVLASQGDLRGACEVATTGAAHAAKAGWSKGLVAAAANLAYILVALGRPEEAERQLSSVMNEPFSSASLKMAVADTRAIASLQRGQFEAGEQLIRTVTGHQPNSLWYELKAQHTLVRLLLRQGKWREASERAAAGLRQASDGQG